MIKDRITVRFFTRSIHCAQLFTGLHLLKRGGLISLLYEDHTEDNAYPYKTAIVEVLYHGQVLTFDMLDGYNELEAIKWFYSKSDFYFKRSFSTELNNLNGLNSDKIFPWGLNYHVSYIGNPSEGPASSIPKEIGKILLQRETNCFFTKRVFEERPLLKETKPTILFCARLWPQSNALSEELNFEREHINKQRIIIIRTLKSLYPKKFIGGLEPSAYAQKVAPDFCLDSKQTQRKKYLSLMHNSDICIATTGLHNSIGWKMGEYVAAAKGIVSEPLHYEVPGPFIKDVNYFEFNSIDSCVSSIRTLYDDPARLYQMKLKNYHYYLSYLEPSQIVANCLRIINPQL